MPYVTRRRATAVYEPLLRILAEIDRTGCVDSVAGKPIFKCRDQGKEAWFETAPAIAGIVDFLDIAISRHQWAISTRPLEVIGLRLAAGVPLSLGDIRKARECIRTAINLSMTLTRNEAADILRTVQTRHLLEAA